MFIWSDSVNSPEGNEMNDFIEPCASAGEEVSGIGVGRRHPDLKDLMISRPRSVTRYGKKAKNESRIHWTGEHGIGNSPQPD